MADERPILELRIHGVNNTKPESMLGLDSDDIEKAAGDALGSFWRPTEAGRAKSAIAADVEIEAYSWGAMARSSLGGGGGVAKIVAGLARVGWALLLPFGLVNVAYWTRKFDDGPAGLAANGDESSPQRLRRDKPLWQREFRWTGRGAPTLRIAGLLVTLLLAVTASVVALDLIAVQCFVGQTKVCAALPSFVDFLTGFGQARRLAVLSLVPVVLIAALLGLSAVTRVRYEQPELEVPDGEGFAARQSESATAKPTWPILSVDGLWSHRKITKVTARLHVAATAVLVSMATSTHILLGYGGNCSAINDAMHQGVSRSTFGAGCWAQLQTSPRAWWELGVLVAGFVVVALILVGVVRGSDYAVDARRSADTDQQWGERRRDMWWNWGPLIAAIALFGAQLIILATIDRTQEPTVRYLVGTSATPAILLAVLLAIAVSALIWRDVTDTPFVHLPLAFVVLVLPLIVWMTFANSQIERLVPTLAIVALLYALGVVRSRSARERAQSRRPTARVEAWNGSAPGVFLLLAVLMAMLLSSAVATAAGNWLNGANTAASLADNTQPLEAEPVSCPYLCSSELQPPNLEVPLPYMWFGAIGLPILVVLAGGVLVAVAKSTRWSGKQPADGSGRPATDPTDSSGATAPATSTGRLGESAGRGLDEVREVALQRRRVAAIAHRAEVFVALLVVTGAFAMIATIGVAAWGLRPTYRGDVDRPWTIDTQQIALDIGMVALAVGGILVIGLAVGGSVVGGVRPLGLVWDLVCFLPRAGHPLAPPCYAERVVPELAERCAAWLRSADAADPGDAPAQQRSIVLSAHSLGSVLAVAVLLSARLAPEHKNQIALLTYGSQLRAYFSRIFPELLGPAVLGTQPCAASRLTTNDPWQHEIELHSDPIPGIPDTSLQFEFGSTMETLARASAAPRWRNLWRRTDYLGFPVVGYPYNPIDSITDEVVAVGYLADVQTHGDYPRTTAYRLAFAELRSALNDVAQQHDSPPPGSGDEDGAT